MGRQRTSVRIGFGTVERRVAGGTGGGNLPATRGGLRVAGRGRRLRWLRAAFAASLALAGFDAARAIEYEVTLSTDTGGATGTVGDLRYGINQVNAGLADTIVFNLDGASGTANKITLSSMLPIVTANSLSIDGSNRGTAGQVVIDGGSTGTTSGDRILFLVGYTASQINANNNGVTGLGSASSTASYTVSNLTLQNGNARGGAGGNGLRGGGGGGAGLGGAVFLNAGTLTATSVQFAGNRAVGGTGGTGATGSAVGSGGGGGGMGGTGGSASGTNSNSGGSGGGGFGIGANGGSSAANTSQKPGSAGRFTGGSAAGNGIVGGNGGSSGGGGGGTTSSSSGGGGGGVGGGVATDGAGSPTNTGGFGGFGGGGGGGGQANSRFNGGLGGFGGGGGGAGRGTGSIGNPGNGGFGGGGGGFGNSAGSIGGYGGGDGSRTSNGGGGGAGLGGGIFVRQGATLNITDGGISGGTATGGSGSSGGGAGSGIGRAIFLAGPTTYTVSAANSIDLTDDLGGGVDALISGGFTKAGTGTLVLSGANAYVGGTTISAGTLKLGHATGLGAVTNALATNATLDLAGFNPTVAGISGSSSGVITSSVAGNATLTTSIATGSATYAGAIENGSGTVSLTKAGAGVQTLSGSNTYTGNTTVSAGILAVTSKASLPGWDTGGRYSVAGNAGLAVGNDFSSDDMTTILGTGNLVSGAALGFDTTAGNRTYAQVVADNGATVLGLVKTGANTLTLTAANTYSGGTTVAAGTLLLGEAAALSGSAASLTVSGGVLDLGGASITRSGAVTVSGGTIQGGTITNDTAPYAVQAGSVSAALAGSVGLTKTGTGVVTLSGANSYGGGTQINAGLLALGSGDALGGSGEILFGGGTLQFSAANTIDYSSRFSTGASQAYSLDTNGRSVTLASALTSSGGSLAKLGTGTLVLTGSNTYTGQTLVSGGVLRATNGAGLPTGSRLTLNGGVIETDVNIERSGGTGAGNMDITGGLRSGFSALGGARQVAFGTLASPTALTWGSAPFAPGTLVLNEATADAALTFANAINLNAAVRTVEVGANTATISGALTGTGASGLTKTGAGRLVLSAVNTYTGATSVDQGTLEIGSLGTINGTSGIAIGAAGRLRYDSQTALSRSTTLAGGGLFYNSAQDFSGSLIFTSGTLGGTNLKGSLGGLTIGTDQILSPGNSPGTAATTSQTWAGGGTYLFEVNSATGSAGSALGWDLLTGTGSLDITASGASPFTIKLASLTLQNASGPVYDFDPSGTYDWLMAEFASPITSFDLAKFTIDPTLFTNSFTGQFTLARGDSGSIGGADTQLYVVYAVPEPGPACLVLAGLAVAGLVRTGRGSRLRSASARSNAGE